MHAGSADFVSLADALRAHPPAPSFLPEPPLAPETRSPTSEPTRSSPPLSPPTPSRHSQAAVPDEPERTDASSVADSDDEDDCDRQAAGRAARLFRAALADAFDGILADLVRDFTVDVLARELRLERVDLAAIARRLIDERLGDGPLRLRVAAADSGLACELPLVVDATLEPGDAILECRSGTVDARLRIRLAALLGAERR